MTKTFDMPLRATRHCRHYSYELGLQGRGPLCARGVDLKAEPHSRMCWTIDDGHAHLCSKREEYTEAERAAWREHLDASIVRLGNAVQALPVPVPLRTQGQVPCPNCDGGSLHYARWHRGAEIKCTTANCCGAHFSIEAGKDWPQGKGRSE